MLKFFSFIFKIALFSTLILILGNTLEWNGRTISDQVRLKMAHAERSPFAGTIRGWAKKVTHDARMGLKLKPEHTYIPEHSSIQEEITSSERQKLKALIRELNHSHKED